MSRDEDEIERLARELQRQVMDQLRQTYSPAVIDHWQNPRNFRRMESPDGYAQIKGLCGDTMEMFLRMRGDRIVECTFQTDGCGTTVVCGSMATVLASGKPLAEALDKASTDGILKALGGLPRESVHCARLAAETLGEALADYFRQKGPSRKREGRNK